jgi:hypothetical protein
MTESLPLKLGAWVEWSRLTHSGYSPTTALWKAIHPATQLVNVGDTCLRRGLSDPNSIHAWHCGRECTQHAGTRRIAR